MTDKTFTDEEIVKALECCFVMLSCEGCPCREPVEQGCLGAIGVQAFSLINRQKAEMADERAKSKMCADVIARQDKQIAEQKREIARLKGEPFYSPEDISKMTPKQIRENYSAIMDSMKKWS